MTKQMNRIQWTKISWLQLYKEYIKVNYLERMKGYRMRENRNRNVEILVKKYKVVVKSDE